MWRGSSQLLSDEKGRPWIKLNYVGHLNGCWILPHWHKTPLLERHYLFFGFFSLFHWGTPVQVSLKSERIWLVLQWHSVWCLKPEALTWIYIIGIKFGSVPCWSKVYNIKDRCKNTRIIQSARRTYCTLKNYGIKSGDFPVQMLIVDAQTHTTIIFANQTVGSFFFF